jgi:hypothetical protein
MIHVVEVLPSFLKTDTRLCNSCPRLCYFTESFSATVDIRPRSPAIILSQYTVGAAAVLFLLSSLFIEVRTRGEHASNAPAPKSYVKIGMCAQEVLFSEPRTRVQ